jgi:hypothetical protein
MMRQWTVAIGSRGDGLVNIRELHGRARLRPQADAEARNAREVVVMGDDTAQLVPYRDVRERINTTFGWPSVQRAERHGRAGRGLSSGA